MCRSLGRQLDERRRRSLQNTREAFTLIELLVVIAIIGILAAMTFPAIGKVKAKSQGVFCMNNLKQFGVGWALYAADARGKLMDNTSGRPWVCKEYLTWDSDAINTNTAALLDPQQSAMADYVRDSKAYKCPADIYFTAANGGPRTRSVSMNGSLNGKPQFINRTGKKYFTAKKLSDLETPGASLVFVFLDEHADSIDDGCFMINPGYPPGQEQWRNLPASYHNNAGSFCFADGHLELHPWLERAGANKTIYPVSMAGRNQDQPWASGLNVFTSRDYEWVADRMPYHPN